MRFAEFYRQQAPHVISEAISSIIDTIGLLELNPWMGRPYPLQGYSFRELVIGFGASGYVALYAYSEDRDIIDILAIRHQKELKYPSHTL